MYADLALENTAIKDVLSAGSSSPRYPSSTAGPSWATSSERPKKRSKRRSSSRSSPPGVVGTAVDAARVTEQMRKVTPELEQSFRLAPRQPPPTPTPPPLARPTQ